MQTTNYGLAKSFPDESHLTKSKPTWRVVSFSSPLNVGLPDPQAAIQTSLQDHVFVEISEADFEPTEKSPTVTVTSQQLIENFRISKQAKRRLFSYFPAILRVSDTLQSLFFWSRLSPKQPSLGAKQRQILSESLGWKRLPDSGFFFSLGLPHQVDQSCELSRWVIARATVQV